MIQSQTRLKVADNTGAKEIMCIKIIRGAGKYGKIGDLIIASVKKAMPKSQVKKKEIIRAVIIRQKKELKRKDGTYIRFDENAAVLINPDGTPRGTRIFGPIPRELKDKGYDKIISKAKAVV